MRAIARVELLKGERGETLQDQAEARLRLGLWGDEEDGSTPGQHGGQSGQSGQQQQQQQPAGGTRRVSWAEGDAFETGEREMVL
jgi:hypothetical protein